MPRTRTRKAAEKGEINFMPEPVLVTVDDYGDLKVKEEVDVLTDIKDEVGIEPPKKSLKIDANCRKAYQAAKGLLLDFEKERQRGITLEAKYDELLASIEKFEKEHLIPGGCI